LSQRTKARKVSSTATTRQARVRRSPLSDSEALDRRATELSKRVQQEPVVDKEKVKEIKEAIENGTYEVDADAIADKLLEMEFQISDKLDNQ